MADDGNARAALEKLVIDFTEAFNRENIDEVMSYFADDAFYDEFNAVRHDGKEAIRAAFVPQFRGHYGKMRFHTEDMFLDVETGKALIRWLLTFEEATRAGGWRGLDLLHFENCAVHVRQHQTPAVYSFDLLALADIADGHHPRH